MSEQISGRGRRDSESSLCLGGGCVRLGNELGTDTGEKGGACA